MRVMVTGGRDWTDEAKIREALAQVDAADVTLVHGACPTGADAIAEHIAREFGWMLYPFPADWKKHARAAGPIRNSEMIAAKPDLVLAFPTPASRGTLDAIRKAKAAGIEVMVIQ